MSVCKVGRLGVLYVLVGVGWWLGESLPGQYLSLGKSKKMLAFFINTVYIIRTSFTKPKRRQAMEWFNRVFTNAVIAAGIVTFVLIFIWIGGTNIC